MILVAALVAAFLSNGITCNGGAVANTSATTPRVNVSLCVTSDVPYCGITYTLERSTLAGTMRVNSRVVPAGQELTSMQPLPFVIADAGRDLGFTRAPLGSYPPASKLLVATWNITVLGSKPATDYGFRLSAASSIATDPLGSCGALRGGGDKEPTRFDPVSLAGDAPIAATFIVRRK